MLGARPWPLSCQGSTHKAVTIPHCLSVGTVEYAGQANTETSMGGRCLREGAVLGAANWAANGALGAGRLLRLGHRGVARGECMEVALQGLVMQS